MGKLLYGLARFLVIVSIFFMTVPSAWGEQVLTVYFAGTGATGEWYDGANAKGLCGLAGFWTPEMISTLHYAQLDTDEGAQLNHHKVAVDGVGTGCDDFCLLDVTSSALADLEWCRGWQTCLNDARSALHDVLLENPGENVILNLVGHSRGGILCFKMANWVENTYEYNNVLIGSRITRINILALDPVAGQAVPRFDGQALVPEFRLGAKVKNFVGIYATDERSFMFSPSIPEYGSVTNAWVFSVPGSHETLSGNIQEDGHATFTGLGCFNPLIPWPFLAGQCQSHFLGVPQFTPHSTGWFQPIIWIPTPNIPCLEQCLDYSAKDAVDGDLMKIPNVVKTIAVELLESPQWGGVQFDDTRLKGEWSDVLPPDPPKGRYDEGEFVNAVNGMWDYDYSLMKQISSTLYLFEYHPIPLLPAPTALGLWQFLQLHKKPRLCTESYPEGNQTKVRYASLEKKADGIFDGQKTWDELIMRTELPGDLPPVAAAGPDQTVGVGEGCIAAVTLDGSGSYDPLNNNFYTWSIPSYEDVTGEKSTTVALAPGAYAITLTASNDSGIHSDKVTVTVQDPTPPTPDQEPLENVLGECSAQVPIIPTASDDCFDEPVEGTTADPLIYNDQGSHTITWIYNYGDGRSITQDQTVIVEDITPPVPVLPDLQAVTGECSANIASAPTATDNCTGQVTGNTTDPLTYEEQGDYTVSWTYDDGNGNPTTQIQSVVVDDVTPPAINAPEDREVECGGPNGTAMDIGLAAATDECCESVTITDDRPAVFPLGETVVTWTAEDCNGNLSTATQIIKIGDTTEPDLSVSVSPDTLWPPNHKMTPIAPTVTVSDICSLSIIPQLTSITMNEGAETNAFDPNYDYDAAAGDTSNDIMIDDNGKIYLRAERAGNNSGRIYTITFTATDASGNTSTSSAEVTVPHNR